VKKLTWILIFLGITIILLALTLIVPVLIFDRSWWWFWGTLIFEAVCWIIAGIILLILHLKSKKTEIETVELDEAIQMAKNHSTQHPDNCDNFIYNNHKITKVGEQGAEKTPIIILKGIGTELNEDRFFIINKENKEEFSMLINPSDEELTSAIVQIAKSQPTIEVTEQVQGVNKFGQATTSFITKRPSRAEVKKEEEEKKAEEKSAF
jgi:hypothetical protein